ncbi:hypothetical protein [Melghirimyces algeriensis]|uniref:Uncharacterized protein n=1 Tax=Melghirimyces algeriensis TaxID=910412 RepID=A0A521CWI1_9BACL|nr:hypothetical protein [Melghirimyces algeriensis]SMO63805.1 hypothetical protein SAMN06264849_104261 [Melghirimyces algeriensis]
MRDRKEYDATYQIGNTTIHIVAPDLTEEERQRRLEEVKKVIWSLWVEVQSFRDRDGCN